MLLAGCAGGGESQPASTAKDAATSLATALSAGNLDGIQINQGEPDPDLEAVYGGMNGLLPAVSVAHVSPTPNVATVKLAYAWPLSSPWTYETEAVLVKDGDNWKLNWAPTVLHPRLTSTNRLERQRGEASERGNITGLGSAVLVEALPVQMLGLDKTGLDQPTVEDSARRVADKAKIDPEAYLKKVHAAGPTAFVDATPVRQSELPADFLAIKGAAMRTVTVPAPKTTGFAQALLGRVGYATAEQAAEVGNTVNEGDIIGVSGLQKTYDKELRGSTGNRVFLADRAEAPGAGRATTSNIVADFPDVPGQSLSTTIDDDVQTAAEEALASVKVPASVAVVNTETGAILAAADSAEARRTDASMTQPVRPGLAGSPVTALALIRSGVDLNERVTCEKQVVVGDRTIENADNYRGGNGQMTLARAIAVQCETAIAAAHTRLDAAKVPEAAKSLGLGATYDIGVPMNLGEAAAPTGDVAKAEALLGTNEGYQASAIGLAAMAASVKAKQPVVPFVVPGREFRTEGAVPLTDAEVKALDDLMRTNAGSYSPLSRVVTGTADGRSWAVGFGTDYALAVVLTDDKNTSTTTAQIARRVATAAR
ncbi:penicillin-binding transpeptidase domain-containing protein [Ammonicoccus fulvus]|uniref:Penicillin-binding transpeptidase domain-containing protein n=1 Tax=Ammonicoccus fulvus TaxID=3138240 RepID=A0ABZ3FW98_9ACTN